MRVSSRSAALPTVFAAAFLWGAARAQTIRGSSGPSLPFPNASFEQGLDEWTVALGAASLIGITRTRASDGVHSLTFLDNDPKRGASITGPRIALPPGGERRFALLARVFPQRGEGLWVSVRFRDKTGAIVTGSYFGGLGQAVPKSPVNKWTQFRLSGRAPVGAATAEVVISSRPSARVMACLDDFAFVPLTDPKRRKP